MTLLRKSYVIPLSRPRITGLRKSKPFWNVLGEKGIFSAILRVPITFPPDRFRGVQLSAMCVPDLRGTHGMFSYFTENGRTGSAPEGEVGGDVIGVERTGGTVRSFLRGPDNTLRAGQPQLRLPWRVAAGRNGTPSEGMIYLVAGKDWMARFNLAWIMENSKQEAN